MERIHISCTRISSRGKYSVLSSSNLLILGLTETVRQDHDLIALESNPNHHLVLSTREKPLKDTPTPCQIAHCLIADVP